MQNFDTEEKKVNEAEEVKADDVAGAENATEEENVEQATDATESVDEETDDSEEASEEPKKKSFFKDKKKKKDPKDEKIEELEDRVKRQMAEFENFRRRTEKEKTQMYEIGAKSVIEKLLPVIDNFERGFSTVTEEQMSDPFVDGMDKVYKQVMKTLEDLEVTPIEAVGQEFNPDLHNAVMQVESEEYESGVVAQELQKGYKYRDSVVRHSMVSVVS